MRLGMGRLGAVAATRSTPSCQDIQDLMGMGWPFELKNG
jgi:hypothetical protein